MAFRAHRAEPRPSAASTAVPDEGGVEKSFWNMWGGMSRRRGDGRPARGAGRTSARTPHLAAPGGTSTLAQDRLDALREVSLAAERARARRTKVRVALEKLWRPGARRSSSAYTGRRWQPGRQRWRTFSGWRPTRGARRRAQMATMTAGAPRRSRLTCCFSCTSGALRLSAARFVTDSAGVSELRARLGSCDVAEGTTPCGRMPVMCRRQGQGHIGAGASIAP